MTSRRPEIAQLAVVRDRFVGGNVTRLAVHHDIVLRCGESPKEGNNGEEFHVCEQRLRVCSIVSTPRKVAQKMLGLAWNVPWAISPGCTRRHLIDI